MAADAWDEAEQQTFAYAQNAATTNGTRALAETADTPRSKNPRQFRIYVEDLTAAKNMMRKGGLAFLRRLERDVVQLAAWTDHCLVDVGSTSTTSGTSSCVVPNSVVAPFLVDDDDATELSDAQVRFLVSNAHASGGSCVTNAFADTNVSSVVRTTWSFGLPIKGYDSAVEDEQKQQRHVDRTVIRDGIAKQVEALVNSETFTAEACSVSCADGVHEFRVYFDYSGLGGGWATRQLSADGPLAGASMAFVWMVMSLHTRSLAIASVGMLQILLSFPVTYFFYRVVLQISHFGTLQVLAVYVILGIGADVATRSFVASLISILAILGIVAVVLGSMVLGGRNLGFMESICVTVVVGLAVDYVVHYGIAFVEHFEEFEEGKGGGKKRERNAVHAAVIGALTDLGVSVLGGATSTFGAALFLLFCVIK